jgi:hypothetical protein
MRTQFIVFSSYGKQMSEPYYTREEAEKYAEQCREDFAEDEGTFFFISSNE